MIFLRRLIAAAFAKSGLRGHQDTAGKEPTRLALEKEQILSNLLATPDLYPTEIDLQRNALLFAQMSRDSYRESAFLDRRGVHLTSEVYSAELTQLLPKLPALQSERPLHFILHGTLCGSTLLARYLEGLPHCFVLKEPSLLGQLSSFNRGALDATILDSPAWADWLKMAMVLLARAYASDTAVVIKAPDLCNWMGHLFLNHDRRTKMVLMSSPLKMLLLQTLRSDGRRSWLRGHMQQLKAALSQVPFLSEIDPVELSDGQCAAAMWLLNSFLCWSLQARSDSGRILVMNGDDFIRQPQDSVRATADFLDLTHDEANRTALAGLLPISEHSKIPRRSYDAAARATDLRDAEARYGSEARAAISWAQQVSSGWLPESPFPVE